MNNASRAQFAQSNHSQFADTLLEATLFAASLGAAWDFATGHFSVFDKIISGSADDEPSEIQV